MELKRANSIKDLHESLINKKFREEGKDDNESFHTAFRYLSLLYLILNGIPAYFFYKYTFNNPDEG